MLDFSRESDQTAQGPVPAGSVVIVEMAVLRPAEEREAPDDPYISVSAAGLRMIWCQFEVVRGSYAGVMFRQNITLPAGAQKIRLAPNYEKACRIGGATLKAICQAAGVPLQIASVQGLSGLRFPVKVKINPRPHEGRDGSLFWNNLIASVITPDKREYELVRRQGEIINPEGAMAGEAPGRDAGDSFPQDSGASGQPWSEEPRDAVRKNDGSESFFTDPGPLDQLPF